MKTGPKLKSLLLSCLVLVLYACSTSGAGEVTTISKDQLKEKLAKPDVTIIDVRANPDFESSEWKIQGARREVPTDVTQWMGKYPKDKTIVLYCA